MSAMEVYIPPPDLTNLAFQTWKLEPSERLPRESCLTDSKTLQNGFVVKLLDGAGRQVTGTTRSLCLLCISPMSGRAKLIFLRLQHASKVEARLGDECPGVQIRGPCSLCSFAILVRSSIDPTIIGRHVQSDAFVPVEEQKDRPVVATHIRIS